VTEEFDPDLREQVRLLRAQVGRLVARNLELERQVEDLRRERDTAEQLGLPIDELAGGVVRAIRLAEEAMAAEAPPDRRYIVADLETSLRTLLRLEANRLLVSLPRHAAPIAPEHYSTVTMRLAPLPPPAAAPERPATVALATHLESLQEAFLDWKPRTGATAARTPLDSLTRLLAARPTWESASVAGEAQALGAALAAFGKTATRRLPAGARRAYSEAVAQFQAAAGALSAEGSASPAELQRLANAAGVLIEASRGLPGRQQG
jgi:hypothetical protein